MSDTAKTFAIESATEEHVIEGEGHKTVVTLRGNTSVPMMKLKPAKQAT